MTINIGLVDRILRFVLGVSLIGLPFFATGTWIENDAYRFLIIVVGIVLIATAALRFCPLYRLLGVRSCRIE